MHGNVWEWCDDAEKGGPGQAMPKYRGGCWNNDSTPLRACTRNAYFPTFRPNTLGLRVARVPVGKEEK
jgi:formylglycine-generating enzyme required for sulfatase activity